MTGAELSLAPSSVRDRFLDLAALVCRQEYMSMTSTDSSRTHVWTPATQTAFSEPVKLSQIDWTSHPQWNNQFSVIAAEFSLLGVTDMSIYVSRNFRDHDKFDDTLNNDGLAILALNAFERSFLAHRHQACLDAVEAKKVEAAAELARNSAPKEPIRITDNRRISL